MIRQRTLANILCFSYNLPVDDLSQHMDKTLLQKLGLTPKEVKLYLKLLELGHSPANPLSKRLNENRTTTYSLLQSLENKGFVSHLAKEGVKYFIPADPSLLINSYFKDATKLKDLLPQLLAIHNQSGDKPKITFYEGVSGLTQIAEQLLEVPGSTRDSFMGLDVTVIHPEFKEYIEKDFLPRRIELGIKYRGIVTGYMPMSVKHSKTEKAHLRELKHVDPQKFPIKLHVDIFQPNKVALYSYAEDEMVGVVIEHESFFITMKTVFTLAWAGVDSVAQ